MGTCQIEGCDNDVFVKARGWCRKHYHRWHRTGDPLKAAYDRGTGPDRWRSKYAIEDSGCWRWTSSLDKHGYGQFDFTTDGKRKNYRAHRFIYQQLVRPLADDETLDHLCRNHACVNPEHLEPVSHAENVRRGNAGKHHADKTHCVNGHPFDADNTIVDERGWRTCIACERKRGRETQRRLRGTAPDAVDNKDKTHCKHGHEFTPENTIRTAKGRNCRECQRRLVREYMRKKRAAA